MSARTTDSETPTHAWQSLLRAAEALLDAKANERATDRHWQALRKAATACWLPHAPPRSAEPSD